MYQNPQAKRLVTLCSASDKLLGQTDVLTAHTWPGLCHRAVSIFMFRHNQKNKIEVLLQQRSDQKIYMPEKWANNLCANVKPGETRKQCLRRRLKEEVGVIARLKLRLIVKFYYHIPAGDNFAEHEVDVVYGTWADPTLHLNPTEVSAVEWVEWDQLLTDIKRQKIDDPSSKYATWLIYMLGNSSIRKAIQKYIER